MRYGRYSTLGGGVRFPNDGGLFLGKGDSELEREEFADDLPDRGDLVLGDDEGVISLFVNNATEGAPDASTSAPFFIID